MNSLSINKKIAWNKPYRKLNKKNLISLVSLSSDELPKEHMKEKNNVHVVYLIDNSGSMSIPIDGSIFDVNLSSQWRGLSANNVLSEVAINKENKSKLDHVKEAVINSIELLSKDDLFSVVRFSSDAECIVETQYATIENKSCAISKINNILPSGMTQMYKGFSLARAQFELSDNKYTKRLCFLTDGESTDNISPECYFKEAKEWSKLNGSISISTFGVGSQFNEEFLMELSVSGSGSFYFLSKDVSFTDIFLREIKELKTLAAKNIRVSIKGSNMADIEMMNDFTIENGLFVLPNLIYGRQIQFAIKCTALGKSAQLELCIHYHDCDGNLYCDMFDIPVSISSENYIDKEVEDFALQIDIAKRQKEASKMIREGKGKEAKKILNNALNISGKLNSRDINIQNSINKTLEELDSGDLLMASKSSLASSYCTFYSRK